MKTKEIKIKKKLFIIFFVRNDLPFMRSVCAKVAYFCSQSVQKWPEVEGQSVFIR